MTFLLFLWLCTEPGPPRPWGECGPVGQPVAYATLGDCRRAGNRATRGDPRPRSLMFAATLAQVQSVDGRARLLLHLTSLRFGDQPRTTKRAIRLRAAIGMANNFRNLVIHGQWSTFAGLYDIDHSGVHTPIGYQANISRFNHRRNEPTTECISLNQAFLQKRANQVWVLSRLLAKFAHFLQAENAKAPTL